MRRWVRDSDHAWTDRLWARAGADASRFPSFVRLFSRNGLRDVSSPEAVAPKGTPGAYRLIRQRGNPFPTATDQDVVVEAGVYAQVTVNFDTGIR